jgi:hypothetical protein
VRSATLACVQTNERERARKRERKRGGENVYVFVFYTYTRERAVRHFSYEIEFFLRAAATLIVFFFSSLPASERYRIENAGRSVL